MRRRTFLIVWCAAALLGTGLLPGGPAKADSVDQKLSEARDRLGHADGAVTAAQSRLAHLQAEIGRVAAQMEAASRDVLAAYEAKLSLSAQLAGAQEQLDQRAARAYETGPGMALEMFLGAETPADFASIQVYTERTMALDVETIHHIAGLQSDLEAMTGHLEERQAALQKLTARLQRLSTEAALAMAAAQETADRMGVRVIALERRKRALERAQQESQASLDGLIAAEQGLDQSALLALLGPTAGRTCDIPPGLEDTGQDVNGIASWYGWDFAGRPTATGAIYDPRLFTAANKELPLNVFLRVKYGGRCAIVLVNDRGPYIEPRVIDLSQAAAEYLGVGLNYVESDVLVPA